MTLEILMKELRKIVKVHPEAKQAQIVVTFNDGMASAAYPNYISYDQKHKPARIKLEE